MGRGLIFGLVQGALATENNKRVAARRPFAHGEFSSRTLADRAFRRVTSTPSKGKHRDRMGEAKRRRQQPAEAAFILGLRDAQFTLTDREDVELTIAGFFRS